MGDSYVSLIINNALLAEPTAILSLMFLFFGRMLPIIALSPFFGARVLPHPVKIAFAILLFIIFLPQFIAQLSVPVKFDYLLLALLIKELVIGLILGTVISLPFIVAQSAGMFIDHQRGGASLMINDPTIQNQSSPIGTMFNMVLIYVFWAIGGPFDFIEAISRSYDLVPLDRFMSPYFFHPESLSATEFLVLFNTVMVMTVQLATPALIAILMTDSFLGLANRLAPQVQITFLGMPLKSLLALVVLALGWKYLIQQMIKDSRFWLQKIDQISPLFSLGQ